MARESIEQRQARLMPGARWLCQQREDRGWSGRELARRMGVAQDRVSAYERAQDQPPAEFARKLAKVLGMSELAVWRGLRLPLPEELAGPPPSTSVEQQLRDLARRVGSWDALIGAIKRAEAELRSQDRPNPGRHGVKPPPVTHKGETGSGASQPEDPAI